MRMWLKLPESSSEVVSLTDLRGGVEACKSSQNFSGYQMLL